MLKVLGWIAVAATVLAASAWGYRATRQHANARAVALRTPTAIDEGRFVTLGGVEQWVQIRGEDRRNPVLLVLHGGPGMSYVPFTTFFRRWERHFTVVQWDRRGVGRTFARHGAAGSGPITFSQLADDGAELARVLAAQLGQEKVILLGHSMGSLVGVLMAKRHPELFHAYVGTDQVVDMPRNEALSYEMLVRRVRAAGDAKAIAAVESIGPPPYRSARRWFDKQRWVSATDPVSRSFERTLMSTVLFAPHYSLRDAQALGRGLQFSAAALLGEIMTFDLRPLGPAFAVPIFIFEGEHDVLDPTELAVEYFDTIEAPRKELVVFPGAGHNALFLRSDDFLRELLARVRPLAR
jgi:pimeloyl-ACP methyl ester carboxylesterase